MTAFLASVRNLDEAQTAFQSGADWLDLKEPAAGALGAVSIGIATDVVNWVAKQQRQVPISATIGDCWDTPSVVVERVRAFAAVGVGTIKIGIFANRMRPEFRDALEAACALGPRIILVCFAEAAPTVTQLHEFAAWGIFGAMLDTAGKRGTNLLDYQNVAMLNEFVQTTRALGLVSGLAGSLRETHVEMLAPLGADYLGFRSALCNDSERTAAVCPRAIRRVRSLFTRHADPQPTVAIDAA